MSEFTELPIPRRNAATDAAARTALQNALVTNAAVASAIGSNAGAIRTAADAERVATYNVLDFGAVGNGTADDTNAIQDALDAADAAGGGVVYIPASDDPYIVTDTLEIGDNTTLRGDGPASVIKKADASGPDRVLTNKDHENGNTRITIRDLKIDGNKEGQTASDFYSTMLFWRLTHSRFIDLFVRGGSRPSPPGGVSSPEGSGLFLRLGEHNQVRGGLYYENEYDGIRCWSSHRNVFSGINFVDNDRAGIQLSVHRDGNNEHVLPASEHNVIANCVVEHSTGTVLGGSSPYISGFAMHTASRNTVIGCKVIGTMCGVDMLEGASYNRVADCLFRVRPASNNAGIFLRDWNNAENVGNVIEGVTVEGISGASRRFIQMDRTSSTRIRNCYFRLDGGSGTWTVELDNNANNNELWLNDFEDTSFSMGSGSGNVRFERNADSLNFRKSNGVVVDIAAPPLMPDADADAIIAAIEDTDAGDLTTAQRNAITKLVTDAKANEWWDKVAHFYGCVGGTAQSHAIDWKDPEGTTITWSDNEGGVTHSADGIKGNGDDEGDTEIPQNDSGADQDDNVLFVYINELGAASTFEGVIGVGTSATDHSWQINENSDNAMGTRNHTDQATTHVPLGPGRQVGLWATQRESSTHQKIFLNGAEVQKQDRASKGPQTTETIRIMSRGASGPFYTGRVCAFGWGLALSASEHVSLYADIQAFQTSLGREA